MKINVRHIICIALFFIAAWSAQAQEQQEPVMPGEKPKPTKYVALEEQQQHLVFFQGFTLSVDGYGPVAMMISDYGTFEGALRLNLKNTFFPIFEAGVGRCSKEDFNTKVTYETSAPFGRIGIDFNMLKDKFQSNRLYLGARYGFSKFTYDIAGPAQTDPIWGGSKPFSMKGINCTSHWAELIFGVEVRIFRNFHMGWAVRYKREIASTKNDLAKPNCIPGYGYTTNATCWGGTYSLIFDLNWGMKKSHKRGVNIEIRDIPPTQVNNEENKKDNGEQTTDNGRRTEEDEE
ncbi:MAG: hypothetical protein IKP41_05570 [Bacteroidaceae bacterium]|nr:hypothetical protein [Bacteroidaceae bacterium]